jgi:hypothetical protein
MSVYEREKRDLAKGKKSGQRGENVTIPPTFEREIPMSPRRAQDVRDQRNQSQIFLVLLFL